MATDLIPPTPTNVYPPTAVPPARRHALWAAGLPLRVGGALTLFAVGAVHLQQYLGNHYSQIPTIGTLFALNFAGATAIGVGLLLPFERLARGRRRLGRIAAGTHALLAAGGVGLSAAAFVFLLVSESKPLFGFMEQGYRPVIIAALAAEAATVALLGAFLVLLAGRGRRSAGPSLARLQRTES